MLFEDVIMIGQKSLVVVFNKEVPKISFFAQQEEDFFEIYNLIHRSFHSFARKRRRIVYFDIPHYDK